MKFALPSRENTRALLLCAVYSFILLFFLSQDSYIRDLFYRCDSAWFFMCGKAWMNGMTPYVDFSDSKGPLLWLIYGLGYLISHHSYVGVFWISVLFYTTTLFLAYKTSRLFTSPIRSVLTVTLLLYFLFRGTAEMHAEDFAEAFVILGFYCLCRAVKNKSSDGNYGRCAFGIGVAFSACLLLKWNIAVMVLSLAGALMWISVRNRKFKECVVGLLVGAVGLMLPFAVYLTACGAFDDFIREYFFNTLTTVEDRQTGSLIPLLVKAAKTVVHNKMFIALVLVTLFACKRYKLGNIWIPVCVAWFIGLACVAPWGHYTVVCRPLFIFLIIPIVDICLDEYRSERYIPAFCVVFVLLTTCYFTRHVNTLFETARAERIHYYRASYVMSQIEKPKIMSCGGEQSIGTPANCLPACKYWNRQWGATPDMEEERRAALHAHKPDFIIWYDNPATEKTIEGSISLEEIKEMGYVFYCKSAGRWPGILIDVYGRPGLRLPPADFRVSDWDIYLKRNIFGI